MGASRDFLTFFDLGSGGSDPQPTNTQNGSNDMESRKDVHAFCSKIVKKSLLFILLINRPLKVKIRKIFGLKKIFAGFRL